jgi:flavorubredoxin
MPTLQPYRIADETFVIPQMVPAPFVGNVHVNTLVIRGAEPVVIDTGMPAERKAWLEQLWSIVEPGDVRWVFLSHDDGDHTGALLEVLDACPRARFVSSWFVLGRLEVGAERMCDVSRCMWINHGDSFDAGDRRLAAVRPPLFDAPTTRGLFDAKTGVYYSADSFGAFVDHHVEDAADLPESDWREGFLVLNRVNHPWHRWIDERKWTGHVDTVEGLGMKTIVTTHGPSIRGPMVEEAFRLIRQVPKLEPWPEPTQEDFELLLTQGEAAAAHHFPMVPPSARDTGPPPD